MDLQEMNAPQRREREIARTRQDIIEAAIRAFVEQGVHATTMQDIAREAGYTAASLYTYFKSKQEITKAVSDMLTAEFMCVFDEPVPSNLSFPQRFELVLARHLAVIEKRRALMLSFHNDDTGIACDANSHAHTFHENFERRILGLADWLKKNAKPEDLGGHPPELVARFFVGTVFGLLHGAMTQRDERLTDRVPLLCDFFFHGVSGSSKAGAKRK
jgi:AcrR family transcriptional regulator